MGAYLEVLIPEGRRILSLSTDRIAVGRAPTNDLVISGDRKVSQMHAVLERIASGWCVRDLGSRNGTLVNGQRVQGDRGLRSGDEIRVGNTRVVLHLEETADLTLTEGAQPPPALTRREREILVALCRPVFSGSTFTEPASPGDIASELVIAEATVKEHVLRLYDKFGLEGRADRRRTRLANEAIERGAVTISDIRGPGSR